jgi:hypothetical protein
MPFSFKPLYFVTAESFGFCGSINSAIWRPVLTLIAEPLGQISCEARPLKPTRDVLSNSADPLLVVLYREFVPENMCKRKSGL